MFNGEIINKTEKRAVLHVALRMKKDEVVKNDPEAVKNVHEVLERIKDFSNQVRSKEVKGYSGKALSTIIVIGIGGSYLGPEFVFEAMKFDNESKKASTGMKLKFLANVDPIDFHRAISDIDIEETLVVINSKTFTTAETMLNARTLKNYIIEHYKGKYPEEEDHLKFVQAHMCAGSTNIPATREFGVLDQRVFGFWDWVGGRFSVCSTVGVLPLALFYGFDNV